MSEIFFKDSFISLGKALDRLQEVIEHPELDTNDFIID